MKEKITEYLKEKYDPIAIILYGSQARGVAKPHSDWDLVLILDEDEDPIDTTEEFEGEYLDLSSIAFQPFTKEFILQENKRALVVMGDDNGAEILFDTDNVTLTLIEAVQKIFKEGRDLTEKEIENRKNFMTRRLGKLQDNIDNDGLFFYHAGIFFEKALQYWFEVKKNRWNLSPREALRIIEKEDEDYFKEIKVMYSAADSKSKRDAALAVYSHLWE